MAPHYSREKLTLPDELLTERLRLRMLLPEDEALMWTINSDPEVMRYVMPPHTDRQAHRKEYLEDLEKGSRFKFFYALCLQDQESPEGWIFLRPTEDGQDLEMGYRLRRTAWGQGLMPEAAQAVMAMASTRWNADAVMALIMPDNRNSQRVAEKLGFAYEGLTDKFYGETLERWVCRFPSRLLTEQ